MRVTPFWFAFALTAGAVTIGCGEGMAATPRQPSCVYELLSLDVTTEHNIRLLRKCAPKGTYDALLLAALDRARRPTPAPKPSFWATPAPLLDWIAAMFRAVWWLAWPLTILALAYVASAIVQPLARYVWRRDPPPAAVPGAEIVIARNLAQLVATADRIAADIEGTRLWRLFPNRAKAAMAASANPAVQAMHAVLTPYFETAYAAMLSSQLSALKQRLASGPQFNLADVQVYYDSAVQSGAGITLRDWADYLDRFGFIQLAAVGPRGPMTGIGITKLGRLFVGWCDDRGYSPQSLTVLGRVF
jgi:hypothetical protein